MCKSYCIRDDETKGSFMLRTQRKCQNCYAVRTFRKIFISCQLKQIAMYKNFSGGGGGTSFSSVSDGKKLNSAAGSSSDFFRYISRLLFVLRFHSELNPETMSTFTQITVDNETTLSRSLSYRSDYVLRFLPFCFTQVQRTLKTETKVATSVPIFHLL